MLPKCFYFFMIDPSIKTGSDNKLRAPPTFLAIRPSANQTVLVHPRIVEVSSSHYLLSLHRKNSAHSAEPLMLMGGAGGDKA
ncbi:hypothetical protein GDO78_004039 [Eleutherodactylus coqui]|uniref:Uncharacterized protein n=1 Tax=Eleutherodactylus coqui TaxID=57060 RepID=A0A8J6JZ77_ELECQ|nr:hypothetical protein GDO78_004039 [Eleutherodactylus coqui]